MRPTYALSGSFGVVAWAMACVAMAAEFVAPPQAERDCVAALTGHGARVQINSDYRVTSIALGAESGNEDLALLAGCDRLEQLQIASPRINDDGLQHLQGLKQLTSITFNTSAVTSESLAKLRMALPSCRITSTTRGRQNPGGTAAPGTGPGVPFGTTSFGMPAASNRTVLIRNAAVHDELKLSDEQRRQITAAGDLNALQRASQEKMLAVLTPDQRTRLKQLELQQSGPAALLREEAADLKLTPDQQVAIRTLIDEAAATMRTAMSELSTQRGQNAAGTELFNTLREKSAVINAQRDEKILAVLSDAQRQQWQTLLGPKGPDLTAFRSATGGARTTRETAAAIFDRYDQDRSGTLTDDEFPASNRTRVAMTRAGVELSFPMTREAFEKAHARYLESSRRR